MTNMGYTAIAYYRSLSHPRIGRRPHMYAVAQYAASELETRTDVRPGDGEAGPSGRVRDVPSSSCARSSIGSDVAAEPATNLKS